MGSTTLVTFLFECPTAARTIELLGSWDNFNKSYRLKPDKRRGHGIWSGCYIFEDIICDGDLDSLGDKRSGALKMGGTYWYYYKVDDEEHHNPSEPSTTVCPLLPGQRLNVLEVPRESRSRSNSESSDGFTRNPQDKFLTPVPPKPLPSPRLGDLCKETYTVPVHPFGGPRSATYPSTSQSLSPGYQRHARSASISPAIGSTAIFTDFRSLKGKLAQKRTASHNRDGSRGVRELEIGAPTLISTTAEEVNLVPLPNLRSPPTSSPLPTPKTSSSLPTPKTSSSLPSPVTAKLREFSPLGSHPIDPAKDLLAPRSAPVDDRPALRPRSRSHAPETTIPEVTQKPALIRAKSADTRRTKIFSNEPWLSSPRLYDVVPEEWSQPAPVLERPSTSLEPPSNDQRPSSSHGGDRGSSLRGSRLNVDKELPALPYYLTPAPLYACNSEASSSTLPETVEDEVEASGDVEVETVLTSEKSAHFSTWSTESITFSSPTSDEDAILSPTFSSLTSNCSEIDSPNRDSARFSISDYMQSPESTSPTIDEDVPIEEQYEDTLTQSHLSASPPRLDELRLSSFGPNLFNLDIQHQETAPRRQAACFGLGFESYKLPEDGSTSKTTITAATLGPGPAIKHDRESSVSHMAKLVNEFGFLGDTVQ